MRQDGVARHYHADLIRALGDVTGTVRFGPGPDINPASHAHAVLYAKLRPAPP
jgi:hypothetical protein